MPIENGQDKHQLAPDQSFETGLHDLEDLWLILDAAQIGAWNWNILTGQTHWSASMEALYGFSPGTFDGSFATFIDCLHPDDREIVNQALYTAFTTQMQYEVEFRIVLSNYDIRWVLSKGQVFYNTDAQPIRMVGIDLDITDRKQAELERDRCLKTTQAALLEAQSAHRIKDEFLAILSHELRSPLNPILGWTKILQSGTLDSARISQALATIERNAKCQVQLIDDLLDMARILRGKLSLNLAPVDLRDVIASAIDSIGASATEKSILLRCTLGRVGLVSGDVVRLHQIIWNLLSNAVKFTPKGGRITIQLKKVGHQAQLTVKDTGCGIDADFLPHIFQFFRQEDASITRNYGGLELGLAIVYQFVEAHRGSITARSPGKDQGATFTVVLPLLPDEIESTQSTGLKRQN
ncbi:MULTISPECIES: PAS domain-containing sensor histidine kinase [Leptolyngbya]|uniref:PAS domain-containing sensor histidine kinase n=1 Tax=Leptolyngbya TaxID=47251 RepID=UPI0016876F81|nr:PAS domain-containing sensor histidine kinase [Leptolyngbya sp. FACHB-1624]MBD1855315.1 PAS domain-containing sensor histidine kinase [Leptolyngbya sp. FACHB-1624]